MRGRCGGDTGEIQGSGGLLAHGGERGGEGLAQLGPQLIAVGRHVGVARAPEADVLLEVTQQRPLLQRDDVAAVLRVGERAVVQVEHVGEELHARRLHRHLVEALGRDTGLQPRE